MTPDHNVTAIDNVAKARRLITMMEALDLHDPKANSYLRMAIVRLRMVVRKAEGRSKSGRGSK